MRQDCPEKGAFDALQELIDDGSNMQPHQMKEGFREHKLNNFASLFRNVPLGPLPWLGNFTSDLGTSSG